MITMLPICKVRITQVFIYQISNHRIGFVVCLKFMILIVECHVQNIHICEKLKGANACKRINGYDTCVCGKMNGDSGFECDPNGKTPRCIDNYGTKIIQDLEATCKHGKYN